MIKTATRIYAGGDNLWREMVWLRILLKSQMNLCTKNVDDIAGMD